MVAGQLDIGLADCYRAVQLYSVVEGGIFIFFLLTWLLLFSSSAGRGSRHRASQDARCARVLVDGQRPVPRGEWEQNMRRRSTADGSRD